MLSKALIKLINSLKLKKYRELHGLYIAEGQKIVNDLLKLHAPVQTIISCASGSYHGDFQVIQCTENEMVKISFLKTSPDVIALVKMPQYEFVASEIKDELSIALDGIQDPGNMGTIVRLANWFGIKAIVCSKDCVDIYNPKVVQATMGALLQVRVHYLDLVNTIEELAKLADYQVYGAFMNGESVYISELSEKGLIVMGNEGKGISPEIEKLVKKRITIPASTKDFTGAESLNVGVATGIIVSEFARRISLLKK